MYPYPAYPAYPMPVYRPPPPKTPEGVKWSLVGLFLALGYFLATMAVAALLANTLSNLDPANLDEILASLLWMIVAAILTGIIGILTIIFYFIGFGYLYAGRNEFGPTHARNLQIALVLAIVALVMYVVSGVVSVIASMSVFSWTGGTVTINAGALYLSAALGIVMGIVVSALVAAHLVLSIRSLVRPEREMILNVAAALGTATPGIAGALVLVQMARHLEILQEWASGQGGGFFGSPPIDASSGIPSVVSALLSVVTILMFILLYREVGIRIRMGELKPILPTPTPPQSWMPGPVVPTPYPTYPTYPPPAPPTPPAQTPPPGPQGPPP